MNRFFKYLVFINVLLGILFISGVCELRAQAAGDSTASIEVLRIGRIPYLEPRKMVSDHQMLLEYFKTELGVKEVKLILTPNYDELNKFLKEGKIDIAWHGTLNYPKARLADCAKVIVMPMRFKKKSYSGIVVTRTDSNINALNDLKGKSFAFVDKKSASGYFFPKIMFLEAGINPDKDFSRIDYLKKHDNILYNILYKKVDAGTVYDDARELLKTDAERAQLKVIGKTADILNEPILIRNGLPEDLVKKITGAFLKLKKDDPKTAPILEHLGNVEAFVPSSDKEYDELVKMVEKHQTLLDEQNAEPAKKHEEQPASTQEASIKK